MVISTTAVNFGLLSEKEQDSLIYAYAGLLNSLSFPVQLLVRTQQKDITAYLQQLEEQEKKQKNPKRAASIASYRQFIATTVKERNVLDKKFYIVIPFSRLELGPTSGTLMGSKNTGLPRPKEYIFEKALNILTPKRDQVLRLVARLGLRAEQLTNEQLIRLFFSIYNPGTPLPEIATLEEIQTERKKGQNHGS